MKQAQVKKNRGQGMVESTISIVLITLFFYGIMSIWFWANNQLVSRQRRYNNTRVLAGTAVDDYTLEGKWPVYTPSELSEDAVLKDGPAIKRGI